MAIPTMTAAHGSSAISKHPGDWIMIISALGLVFLFFTLIVRCYVRFKHGSIGRISDCILILAVVFATGQTALVFWQVSLGLGNSLNDLSAQRIQSLQKISFATTFLYLGVLALTKSSVLSVYLQLTPDLRHNRATWIVLAFVITWLIASCVLVGTNCHLGHMQSDLATSCSNMIPGWRFVAGYDVATELLIFALSIFLVVGKQMKRQRKIIVIFAFGVRLGVILPALFRLYYITQEIESPTSRVDEIETTIWTQVQILYSVFATISYCWKAFTADFGTTYGSLRINVEVFECNKQRGIYDTKCGVRFHQAKPDTSEVSLPPAIYDGTSNKRYTKTVISRGEYGAWPSKLYKDINDSAVVVVEEIIIESHKAGDSSSSESGSEKGD